MHLLDDIAYEQLLRMRGSGSIAYAGVSPSCGQYPRLKLRRGGPSLLRTPDHLNGVPGTSPADPLKVQENHTMLSRCLQCLILVFPTGGHVHLEHLSQPCHGWRQRSKHSNFYWSILHYSYSMCF